MKQEIIMRGKTASGGTEVLEFSGIQIENKNMAYKLVEFQVYPSEWDSTGGAAQAECVGSITAGKTAAPAIDVNFLDDGLIANAFFWQYYGASAMPAGDSVINNHYLITQNLILMVQDNQSSPQPVNWQCKFKAYKMTDAEMAANNFKQFQISDGS